MVSIGIGTGIGYRALQCQGQPGRRRALGERAVRSVERLGDFPEIGRVVPEVGVRRIRELIFGAYRIIYRVKDTVEILTVRRGSQLLDVREVDDERE